ncbi:MAG: hypothetical protein AAB036_00005 [Elusimicrobiota bacterium]
MSRLSVCWTNPSQTPSGPVLSFLPPRAEEELAARAAGQYLRARDMPPEARAKARVDYLQTCARIGAGRVGGRTLREDAGGSDAWWHHPVSFKDCENDPTFARLLAVRAVLWAADATAADEIETWGAPPEVVDVLRGRLAVIPRNAPWRSIEPLWWLRALGSRAYGLAQALLDILACSLAPRACPAKNPRVALLGYWDWSVRSENGLLIDRYFKALPQELSALGAQPARLCWLDTHGDPARAPRGRLDAARAASAAGVALLQSTLDLGDAFEAACDLRPASAYLRRRDDPAFRAIFLRDGLDLFPLFAERLLRGFLDGCLPRCALIRAAVERACKDVKPGVCVHFLEHFPHARACFAGARAAGARTAAVQHAGFCLEKTFYFLDPDLEFRGEPDGRAVPVPDIVFAMGEVTREHFLSCGYTADQVVATGSPRYDHVRPPQPAKKRAGPGVRVLLAPALDLDVESAMLEAAAAASEGLAGVELRLRDHPFAPLSRRDKFKTLKDHVRLSTASLDEDLAWADLVLFSYSTVAEEAVLKGIPAWQWKPLSYDASALSEAADIPRFTSVAALRAALERFRPGDGLPGDAERARLVQDLFLLPDGGAARRVASYLNELAP